MLYDPERFSGKYKVEHPGADGTKALDRLNAIRRMDLVNFRNRVIPAALRNGKRIALRFAGTRSAGVNHQVYEAAAEEYQTQHYG